VTRRSSAALTRMRTTRSERLGALVTGLAAEDGPGPDVLADELDEVVTLALHHRLPGLVYQRLRDAGASGTDLAPLADAYRAASTHNLAQLAQLAQLRPVLDDTDPSWLVVKGPVLAGEAYGDPGLRTAYDLDLVVSPERFPDVLAALEAIGSRPRQRNWPLLTRLELGQLVVDLPLGGTGDLHWHLVNTPFARRRFALDMDELRERRRTVTLDGVRVPTLDPSDTVLHLCVHGALSGGHLLVWTKDLARATATLPVDWDELVRRARLARLALVAAVQLERARVVLGAPVDPAVVRALAPRSALVAAWSRVDRTRRSPWARDHRTGKTVSAALSATAPETLAELVRGLPSEVVVPRLAQLARRPPSPPPGQSPLTRPAGGEEARRRYLDFVVAQGATHGPPPVRR
jgi:hypothetical protein